MGFPLGLKSGGSYYLWSGDERGLDHAWYFGLGNKENYFNLKDLADMEQGVKMVISLVREPVPVILFFSFGPSGVNRFV